MTRLECLHKLCLLFRGLQTVWLLLLDSVRAVDWEMTATPHIPPFSEIWRICYPPPPPTTPPPPKKKERERERSVMKSRDWHVKCSTSRHQKTAETTFGFTALDMLVSREITQQWIVSQRRVIVDRFRDSSVCWAPDRNSRRYSPGSIPHWDKVLFSQSQLLVQDPMQCSYSVCEQSHASI